MQYLTERIPRLLRSDEVKVGLVGFCGIPVSMVILFALNEYMGTGERWANLVAQITTALLAYVPIQCLVLRDRANWSFTAWFKFMKGRSAAAGAHQLVFAFAVPLVQHARYLYLGLSLTATLLIAGISAKLTVYALRKRSAEPISLPEKQPSRSKELVR